MDKDTKALVEAIKELALAVADATLALDHLAKATDVKRSKDKKKH